jgi:hypothetical protein
MEAEVRAILEEAVREPADSTGLFTALLDRFGALGGVDLDLPGRDEPARRGFLRMIILDTNVPRSFGVNATFMQVEVHEWDIHAV